MKFFSTRRDRKDTGINRRLAVLVPVYNEQDLVIDSLRSVFAAAKNGGWEVQVIVVDDGSRDYTLAELNQFARLLDDESLHVASHGRNRGKGAAIRTGLELVTAPLVVCHDADLKYAPNDLSKMLDAISLDNVDVVYGSRCLPGSINPRRWNLFAFGVSTLNLAVRLLYGIRISDEATCYTMFRTEDLRRMDLQCEGFEFCPEVTAKALRLGLRIQETPISYRPRSQSEGKKIRLSDGWEALKTLWFYRRWKADPRTATQVPAVPGSKNMSAVPHARSERDEVDLREVEDKPIDTFR